MSDHEFENYLTLISRLLRLSPAQREAIGEELRDHFESRLAELLERGVAHDEAVRVALEEFGDAAGLAASFTSISQTRRRRLIMRCTVASVSALAAAVIVAMAVWPEHNAGKFVANAAAQAPEKAHEAKTAAKTVEALNAETEAKLNELTEAEFVEQPLSEALRFLGDKHRLQFFTHKASLRDAAIDLSAIPVSIDLKNVRLKTFLSWMLSENNLAFAVREGVVVIATQDYLNCQLETRVYDCRDIFAADKIPTLTAELKPAVSGHDENALPRTSMVAPQYLHLAQISESAPKKTQPATPTERLTNLIRETIAAQTWSKVGGPGTIVEYQGLLIVSQTAEVHNEIKDLLSEISARLGIAAQ